MKHALGCALIPRDYADTLRDAEAVDDLITVRISLARQRNRAGQPMLIERVSRITCGAFAHLIHKLLDALIHWRRSAPPNSPTPQLPAFHRISAGRIDPSQIGLDTVQIVFIILVIKSSTKTTPQPIMDRSWVMRETFFNGKRG